VKDYVQLIPLAITIAKMAEDAVPIPGKGKEKLAFAIDVAANAYAIQDDLRTNWKDKDEFIGAIGRAVNSVVTLLNAAGIFGKKTAAA
jgi:hypothetical protein